MAQLVKNPPTNAGNTRDTSSIPGPGSSPGEGSGNQLQYPHPENSMDRSLEGYNPWGYNRVRHGWAHMHAHAYTHTNNETLLGHVQGWNLAICDNINGLTGCYAEVHKSDRERQIPYALTYMWDRKSKYIFTDTENKLNKLMVAREEEGGGMNDISGGDSEAQAFSNKISKSWGCNT